MCVGRTTRALALRSTRPGTGLLGVHGLSGVSSRTSLMNGCSSACSTLKVLPKRARRPERCRGRTRSAAVGHRPTPERRRPRPAQAPGATPKVCSMPHHSGRENDLMPGSPGGAGAMLRMRFDGCVEPWPAANGLAMRGEAHAGTLTAASARRARPCRLDGEAGRDRPARRPVCSMRDYGGIQHWVYLKPNGQRARRIEDLVFCRESGRSWGLRPLVSTAKATGPCPCWTLGTKRSGAASRPCAGDVDDSGRWSTRPLPSTPWTRSVPVPGGAGRRDDHALSRREHRLPWGGPTLPCSDASCEGCRRCHRGVPLCGCRAHTRHVDGECHPRVLRKVEERSRFGATDGTGCSAPTRPGPSRGRAFAARVLGEIGATAASGCCPASG